MLHRLSFFCLFLAACGLSGCAPEKPPVNIGDAAPAFQAEKLDGSRIDFPAALAGQPVVIRFWADWCPYCAGEMQAIEKIYRRHGGRDFTVLAINAGQDRESVTAFVQRIGVSYPILLDPQAAIARRYGVVGLPTTFFVDRQGVIRAKLVGEASEAVFADQIEALL
jgi:peroxiredoxin